MTSTRSTPEERAAHAALHVKNTTLAKIIRPLRTAQYEVDYEWNGIERMLARFAEDYGHVDLDPDFQRGHVWTADQQRHFIENVLRGVVASSGFLIQFNCPNWESDDYRGDLPLGMQCVDGLQRITAVREFLADRVRPFGLGIDDLAGSSFSVKSRYRFRVAIHNFRTRADLLQHYLDLNAGGTPHSPDEIKRVQGLLASTRPTDEEEGDQPRP